MRRAERVKPTRSLQENHYKKTAMLQEKTSIAVFLLPGRELCGGALGNNPEKLGKNYTLPFIRPSLYNEICGKIHDSGWEKCFLRPGPKEAPVNQ